MNKTNKPIRLNIDPEYLKEILKNNPNTIFSVEGLLIKISMVNEVKQLNWEDEKAFIDMLIEDMEESRNTEYSQDEIDAFDNVLKKFIE